MSIGQFSSVTFSVEASNLLRDMSRRTGITPNLLARTGFCLSLKEPIVLIENSFEENDLSIERRTLTGVFDELLITLLRQQTISQQLSDEELVKLFKVHMERGVLLLRKRLKGNINNLASALITSQRQST